MDFDLEKIINARRHSDNADDLTWYLTETYVDPVDDSQSVIDLSPWLWSVYFSVTELTLHDSCSIGKSMFREQPVTYKRHITGSVVPISPNGRRPPIYSMLGTDRLIQRFGIRIEPLPHSADEYEHCTVWGSAQHTSEIDFTSSLEPDELELTVYVSNASFERYALAISDAENLEARLTLRMVDGFYAPWSPSIKADLIKVLTDSPDHQVHLSTSSDEHIPRLGKVGESVFSISTHRRLASPQSSNLTTVSAEETDQIVDQVMNEPIDPSHQLLLAMSKLQMVCWLMVALLATVCLIMLIK